MIRSSGEREIERERQKDGQRECVLPSTLDTNNESQRERESQRESERVREREREMRLCLPVHRRVEATGRVAMFCVAGYRNALEIKRGDKVRQTWQQTSLYFQLSSRGVMDQNNL